MRRPAATSVRNLHAVDERRRLAGLRIRVSVRPGDGTPTRPLLLLNGIGAPLELWEPLRRRLAPRTTIAFDAPGTGGSPVAWVPPTIPALARVVHALLDDLGVDEADVLGYSFGGAVAQEVALRHPDRVGSLVLAATNCGWASVPGDPIALGGLVGRFGPGAGSARRPHPLGLWHQLLAISTWTAAGRLGRISAPTLVLSGDADRIVPPVNGRLLALAIRDATVVEVAGAGHFAMLGDDPDASFAEVERFLAAGDPAQEPGLAAT